MGWRAAVCGIAAWLFSGNATALEWYLEPSVSVGYEHHDNIRLTTQPHDSISGTSAAAQANLGVRAPTWDLRANLRAKSVRFDEEAFDRDDYQAKLFARALSQRSVWQLDAARLQESLLTSDEIDPDTGLPLTQRNRWTETVSPSWIRSLDATTQIQFRFNDTHVTYEDGSALVNLFDYRAQSVDATLSKQWSARTTVSLTLAGSRFEVPDNGDLESRTLSAYAGVSHQFTPLVRAGASIGVWRNESEFDTCVLGFLGVCFLVDREDTTDTGTVLRADVERQLKRSRISGSYARDIRPSGSGTEVEIDQVGFSVNHQIRDSRFWAVLTAEAIRTRTLGQDPTGIDRDYYQVSPRLRYKASREWEIDASYRHARRQFEVSGDAASNDSVYLTLTYRPPRMSRSR